MENCFDSIKELEIIQVRAKKTTNKNKKRTANRKINRNRRSTKKVKSYVDFEIDSVHRHRRGYLVETSRVKAESLLTST